MSVASLAHFIRYHKSTNESYTIYVYVGTDSVAAIEGAHVFDIQVENNVSIVLPGESAPVVLNVNGPVNPRLNMILFEGYTASVFLHP